MKYNIKSEYLNNNINEDDTPKHEYRKLLESKD